MREPFKGSSELTEGDIEMRSLLVATTAKGAPSDLSRDE